MAAVKWLNMNIRQTEKLKFAVIMTRFCFGVCGLQNTRVALNHLEAIPEKQCLMENFKDLEVGSVKAV